MDPFARTTADHPYHEKWTQRLQSQPPETAIDSPLLALARSSDVDPVLPEQVADARQVLRWRRALVEQGETAHRDELLATQRRIVERFLSGRRAYFGRDQSQPLPKAADYAREGRDVFIVIKFMDEAPHIAATLHSLLNQEFDMRRVVIVAVDNNSTDDSAMIVHDVRTQHRSAAELLYLNQSTPGAGNAARLGVDTCLATLYEMCRIDGDWQRLQTATIAVSDGDTVYHPETLRTISDLLGRDPTVDAVMPFLTYKFTAALRLMHDYQPAVPAAVAAAADSSQPPTLVNVELGTITAHDELPRWQRRRRGDEMVLTDRAGTLVRVPLAHTDPRGRRFGVLVDRAGRQAYIFDDRTLLLAEAPVAGMDAALVFLENGGVRPEEKWRWHAVIGHDFFLYWSFRGMGLPERMVFPDTSDALKTVRAWSFAIGGQHQLRRPGLRIATGSDYQSGRVLQAVGCTVRLGSCRAFAETETDRLIKMVRNFVRDQSVFYGGVRSEALERATGLYVHMTRIQSDIEQELLDYDDRVFEHTVFPERVLFPLRWMLQNAIRFWAHGEVEGALVRERVLRVMFSPAAQTRIERELLTAAARQRFDAADYLEQQRMAEQLAERIIGEHYRDLMVFYCRTLRDFLQTQQVAPEAWEWLLDGLAESRNAVIEHPSQVDPTVVWEGAEFEIDEARGQVVRMRRGSSA